MTPQTTSPTDMIRTAIPQPPRPRVTVGRMDDEEWGLVRPTNETTGETAEVTAAQDALSEYLTRTAGGPVVVLGVGSYDARRMPLTVMASSEDAALMTIETIEQSCGLRLEAYRHVPLEDDTAVHEPGFGAGYYMCWFDGEVAPAKTEDEAPVSGPVTTSEPIGVAA